ncbi:MAG TPA: hypothetical protein VFO10_05235 [Oligoflexus sp.]|uniref:hypothetical protein n=1 Tax=Oligoflexus sp. TaxID=1971216 RepID=UPI002D80962B|nr:hypothetical protein [Oligoflexus sp.]HET9236628.1 hypothetical protein [Oligoflexus sp.]
MLRILALLSAFSLVIPACDKKSGSSSGPTPAPDNVPNSPADTQVFLKDFTFQFLAPVQGQASQDVELRWTTNAKQCALSLSDRTYDVSKQASIVVTLSADSKAELTCGSARAQLNIVLPPKLSLVHFTIEPGAEGEVITWKALSAKHCQLIDTANGLDLRNYPAEGSYTVTTARAPLKVTLECESASGSRVASTLDVATQISPSSRLSIESFTGPAESLKKKKSELKVDVPLQWKVSHAKECRLAQGSESMAVNAESSEQRVSLAPGTVQLECLGSRFQRVSRQLTISTRAELELVAFRGPAEGFYGSSRFDTSRVTLQVNGAQKCEVKADNASATQFVDRSERGSELEKGIELLVYLNQSTKSLVLNCSNEFGEKLQQNLGIEVKPRVDVIKFLASPGTIKTRWLEPGTHKVSLSWSVENAESCEILVERGREWVVLKQLNASMNTGEMDVDVKQETHFRISCKDGNNLTAYNNEIVRFEYAPDFSVTATASELKINAAGYETCSVSIKDLDFKRSVNANEKRVIYSTVRYPLLTVETDIQIYCTGSNVPSLETSVAYVSDPRYVLLRNAQIQADQISVDAVWELGSHSKGCKILKVDGTGSQAPSSVLLNDIARKGRHTLRVPFDLTTRFEVAVECDDPKAERLADTIAHPVQVCEKSNWKVRLGYDLPRVLGLASESLMKDMSCQDIFDRFVALKIMPDNVKLPKPLPSFLGSVTTVTRARFDGRGTSGVPLGYFANATSVDYDTSLGRLSGFNSILSLEKLERLTMRWGYSDEIDLRFLQRKSPRLKSFALLGDSRATYVTKLDRILRGLELEELALENLQIAEYSLYSLTQLPLKKLHIRNLECKESAFSYFDSCLKNITVPDKKIPLTSLVTSHREIDDLEKLLDLSALQELEYYRQSYDGYITRPHFELYANLKSLIMHHENSIRFVPAGALSQLKSLTLDAQNRDEALDIADIATKFPALESLGLKMASIQTLNSVWKLKLGEFSLSSSTVENWDLPLNETPYVLPVFHMNAELTLPAEGLFVQTLISEKTPTNILPAGVVQTLDLSGTGELLWTEKGLSQQFGQVKTILLAPEIAEGIRDRVKTCEIMRVMKGTTLVYPEFEPLWAACEGR